MTLIAIINDRDTLRAVVLRLLADGAQFKVLQFWEHGGTAEVDVIRPPHPGYLAKVINDVSHGPPGAHPSTGAPEAVEAGDRPA